MYRGDGPVVEPDFIDAPTPRMVGQVDVVEQEYQQQLRSEADALQAKIFANN